MRKAEGCVVAGGEGGIVSKSKYKYKKNTQELNFKTSRKLNLLVYIFPEISSPQ